MADQQPPTQPPPPGQPPQWSPPPQQSPQWGTPPPGQWGQGGYAPAPQRPVSVTLAGIYLIVMGILLALVGGCTTLVGGGVSQVEGQEGTGTFFGGSIVIIGLIATILNIAGIVAGAGAIGRAGWGRWLGVVVSVILLLLFGLIGVATVIPSSDSTTNPGLGVGAFFLTLAVMYALTAWALLAAGRWFSRQV